MRPLDLDSLGNTRGQKSKVTFYHGEVNFFVSRCNFVSFSKTIDAFRDLGVSVGFQFDTTNHDSALSVLNKCRRYALKPMAVFYLSGSEAKLRDFFFTIARGVTRGEMRKNDPPQVRTRWEQ